MRPRHLPVVVLVALSLMVAACGDSGGSADGTRTIDIDMRDTAYSPDHVTVHAGEAVRFVFHNQGAVAHDAFLGDEQAQMDHESTMGSTGTMGDMGHGDSDAITVEPGETGTLTHTFQSGDEVVIGCHETGHYAAGMKLTIDVT